MVVMTCIVVKQVTHTRMVVTRLAHDRRAGPRSGRAGGEHRVYCPGPGYNQRTTDCDWPRYSILCLLLGRNYSIYNSYPQFNRLFIHFRQNPATVSTCYYTKKQNRKYLKNGSKKHSFILLSTHDQAQQGSRVWHFLL